MEATRSVRVVNPAGLHARPCHAIVTTANGFESELRVECEGNLVNGRSNLELMTLSAPCESVLTLRGKGRDAEEMVERVARLVEAGFDEM